MSRITSLFATKRGRILSLYVTAGFPELHDTLAICRALVEEGVDMLELGMPFSDPIADGPTIQRANTQAIAAGFSMEYLFQVVRELRTSTQIPLLLMGHINPILQYGFTRFCSDAASAGIDGVIIPDLPPEECDGAQKMALQEHGLQYVCLITPETSDERARAIDAKASGFLYVVSSHGVTGGSLDIDSERQDYFRHLRTLDLKNPLVVGFGVDSPQRVGSVLQFADAVIVGSALIREIEKPDARSPAQRARDFSRFLLSGVPAPLPHLEDSGE